MLHKFVVNISESKDGFTFWEINRYDFQFYKRTVEEYVWKWALELEGIMTRE